MHSKKVIAFSAIILVTLLLFGACLAACASNIETTITYYVDGEVYQTVTVTGTDMADPKITPSKTGFTFVGWYTDEEFSSQFFFSDYAANENRTDISVYAKFSAQGTGDYRTVTFDSNGGDQTYEPRLYEVGTYMSLPVPTLKGYIFITWEDEKSREYNSTSIMPDEDLFLRAVWEKEVTTFEDSYVSFTPASEGKKHDSSYYLNYSGVQEYLYVELTSSDLGGRSQVGRQNNFDLTSNTDMEYSVKGSYTLNWYEGSWNVPNGAQLFTLDYGSNIQLLTVSEGQRVVKRYLVDIYVLHDYSVDIYTNIFSTTPSKTVWGIENRRLSSSLEPVAVKEFEFDRFVVKTGDDYIPYSFSEVVRADLNLYQTYKPKDVSVTDEDGNALGSISVTPYTEYENLDTQTKEGHDFIGYKYSNSEDAKYFADIEGNTATNYISVGNNIDELVAVFEPKHYYQYVGDDEKIHVEPGIPVVVYEDSSKNVISEIKYTTEGKCVDTPDNIPYSSPNNQLFTSWRRYVDGSSQSFDFTEPITAPTAIYPTFRSQDSYTIPLGKTVTYQTTGSYTIHLPITAQYKLEISTQSSSSVEFSISGYGDENMSYVLGANQSKTITIDWVEPEFSFFVVVRLNVSSIEGSFQATLTGASAVTSPEETVYFDDDNTIVFGEKTTLIDPQNKVGYSYNCTDESGNSLTRNIDSWNYADGQVFEIKDYFAINSSITFDTCGGDEIEVVTQLTDSDLTLPTPQRDGYVFAGWYSEPVPSDLSARVEWTKMPGGTHELYAVWSDVADLTRFEYEISDDEVSITDYTGYANEVTIPSVMFDLPVTSIGNSAFNACGSLTSIVIPNSVKSIGWYAFYGCSNLTNLTIGNNVTSIGIAAFEACSNLISITVPNSVTNIGSSAFSGCSSLTSITVPDSVTSIGLSAFSGCNSLTSITLPFVGQYADGNGATNFGYIFGTSTYENNDDYVPTSLTEVVITGGESIGSSAFYGCSSLTSITLPFVGQYADGNGSTNFGYIFGASSYSDNDSYVPTSLKEVVITDGESIDDYAFYNCSGLTSITVPNSVTSIGSSAFSGCSGLTSITVPNSVTSIGSYAFSRCSGLTSIDIPGSVTSIGSSAFSGCSGLTSITIGGSVTSIGSYAFSGCSGLTSVTIPESVTSIGVGAFAGSTGLESLSVAQGNTIYHSDNNCIIETATKTLIAGCKNSVIPDDGSVTSIDSSAFYDCDSLASITIPGSVTSIGSSAFYDCDSLASITIPDSVTSIGSAAFQGCSSLTSITLPFVGENADRSGKTHFGYIFGASTYENNDDYVPTSLTEVVITGGEGIVSYAFYGCSSLTSITIPDSVTSIGEFAFASCSSLKTLVIANSVTTIGNNAFAASGITIISLPSSIQSIGDEAFYNCKNLKNIVIPDGVTSIGRYAFGGCDSLTSITLPFVGQYADGNGSTNFGYIFGASSYSDNDSYVPTSLKEVVITGGEIIDDNAFRYCSKLTSITIPDSVTSIGNHAFYGCSNLAGIDIPNSVTSIGSYAFYGCDSLTSIVIPDNVTSIGVSAFAGSTGLESLSVAQGNTIYHSDNNCIIETATKTLIAGYKNSVIPDDGSVTSIGSAAFQGCSSLTSITIPESVTSIGSSAFSGCSSLTSITIPDSVTSIGSSAFSGCSSLTIYCEVATQPSGWGSNWNYSDCPVVWDCNNNDVASDGYIYYVADSGIRYVIKRSLSVANVAKQSQSISGDIVIPESVTYKDVVYNVTSIGSSAFSGCSGLTSITVPESVTSIADYTFSGCSSLTSIDIPGSVTSIGERAFYGCSSLTSVTIPESVTSIGEWAFNGCDSLTSITILGGVTSINGYVFQDCSSLISIVIPNSVTSIGRYAFSGCSSLTSIVIPESVTSIGNHAFSECSRLPSIVIPDSVTSFGEAVFMDCTGLISITIGDGVTSISRWTFQDCSSLTSVTIGAGVTRIDNNVFGGCTGLTSIVIPDSVKSIGSRAFLNCSSLTSIVIGGGVKSISEYAFQSCSSLTSIFIPDSVTSIGNYAFQSCYRLTIYCEAESKPSGWYSKWNYYNRPVVWGYTEQQ